jgi:hypothetical protein
MTGLASHCSGDSTFQIMAPSPPLSSRPERSGVEGPAVCQFSRTLFSPCHSWSYKKSTSPAASPVGTPRAARATKPAFMISTSAREAARETFLRRGEKPAPTSYFPPALIALRSCASASSLQYLQFSCRKTEVYGTVMVVFRTTM